MVQNASTALYSSSIEASQMKRSHPRHTVASRDPHSRLPRSLIPGQSWRAALLTVPGPHHRPVSSQKLQGPREGQMETLQMIAGLHRLGAGRQQASQAKTGLVQVRELPGGHVLLAPSDLTHLWSVELHH